MMSTRVGVMRTTLLTAIVCTALTAACRKAETTPGNPTAPPAAAEPREIDTTRVTEQPLELQLSLPAELNPYQSVGIYARVTGFVKSVSVDRGSRVGQGQAIALLDAPELIAHRAEAQSRLQAAEAQLAATRARADGDRSTFERLKAASATPGVVAGNDVVIAEKNAEAGQSQVVSAQQTVEAAKQALAAIRDMESYLQVTAPFAGVITERNIHPGALVGPSSGAAAAPPLFRLVDSRRLRLVVPVPEAYTSDISSGTSVPFSVAAHPGQSFTGTVARIAQAVDISSRTMAVELEVANDSGRLAPGTFATVNWPVRRAAASMFVPATSVASTTDRTFVVRINGGKAEWVDVKTGLTSGALIEVFGAMKSGDEIAVRGTDELRPGTLIRPRPAKPAA